MQKKLFMGDKKVGGSLLFFAENKLADFLLKITPSWLKTYHLTLMTILWSALVIVFGLLAMNNISWLWASSVVIFLQYITDLIDGKLGKLRKTGLIRWSYYMDHFLDYIFLCSILISYSFLITGTAKHLLFFVLAVFGGFMVNSYLSFAATNKFKISYLKIGPTEVRIIFIVINTFFIFGKTYSSYLIPYVLIFALIGLCVVVWQTQKYIWHIDERNKKEKIR